jgi:hypothetical protein
MSSSAYHDVYPFFDLTDTVHIPLGQQPGAEMARFTETYAAQGGFGPHQRRLLLDAARKLMAMADPSLVPCGVTITQHGKHLTVLLDFHCSLAPSDADQRICQAPDLGADWGSRWHDDGRYQMWARVVPSDDRQSPGI